MAQSMNLLQGPEPVETAELHFKLHCRLKVFETSTKYEEGHCCILAVSQYYGLIFVGNLNGFSVISTKSLTVGVSPDEYPRRNIVLTLRPSFISVDISQKVLAVVCSTKSGSVLSLYNIKSFADKDVVGKFVQTASAQVVDFIWQPNAEGSFVLCLSDGSVMAFPEGTKNKKVFTLPATTQATCCCWSPKGKQIVIGTATGTLSQYKPDLKLVKTLPAPPLYNGAVMVVSVLWISSFQFAVAYNDRSNPESFPVITIVNAAKNEPVTVINYDDITYSSTLFRNHQIYMSHQPAWNLIFVSSANSIETAVLHMKDNASWEQWLLGDASRAELPLNPDRQETFPLGWAFDFTSQEGIPWGEGSLPPMPRLLLVSDEGLLCVFNVVNAGANAAQLCAPPGEVIDQSHFTTSSKLSPPPAADLTTPVQPAKSILGSPPNLVAAKPTFTFQPSPGFGGFAKAPQNVTISLQQQPEQPPVQIQQQPQPQQQLQPQIQLQPPPRSEPSTASFKLSVSQFGTPSTFSFGTTSSAAFSSKPPAAKVVEPTGGGFTLQPTASQKDLFSGKNLPQSTPVKQTESPVEKSSPAPVVKKPEEVEPPPRTEEVPAKGESPELTAVDDSVYLDALQEEIDHFNSELQQLSAKVGKLNIQLGTEEDKAKMKKSIEGLHSFWKELKETTEGQSSEIHAVVMDLMEAFAWLENAKSRNLQRKNPSYIELKKSEELDPLNARHMNEISHLKYYIENQLKQLTGYLEKEWMDHQENYRNEVKSKMTVPPLEEVYKTMHYQLKILQKQKTFVEELKEKIAVKKRKNKSQMFIVPSANSIHSDANGNRVSELSKLAENLLQLKINREDDSPQSGHLELMKSRLAAISDRSKKLTRDKQTALRDVLSERDMVKIRPVKTSLESSSFLRALHLEKAATKTPKPRPFVKSGHHQNQKESAPVATAPVSAPLERKPDAGKLKSEEKAPVMSKPEVPKNVTVPVEKSTSPLTVSFAKTEDKSPLNSLSKIVSNIGAKNETPFVFGGGSFQKTEPSKDVIVFGSAKLDQKPEEPKPTQPFTFGAPKSGEFVFGKKEPTIFGAKPTFNLPSSISIVMTKPDSSKAAPAPPNITIAPVTTTSATSSPFSFSATTSATSFTFTASTTPLSTSTPLPKVNVLAAKDGTTTFGAPASTTATTSLFTPSISIFGGAKTATTTFTTSTSLFGAPKTTDTPASSFTFVQPETKPTPPPANEVVSATVKPTSETEEVDVVGIEEPPKKPEPPAEKSKDSPKASVAPVAPSIFSTPTSTKAPPADVTSTAAATPVSAPQSSIIVFPKSLTVTVTPSAEVSASPAPPVTTSTSTPTTTSSVFSFASVSAPIFFGQTTTTTTVTTTTTTAATATFFGTPTSTPTAFGQVSSTTPTTNIFGGSTPASPSASIFGGSTPVKAAADPSSTPSTTSDNIFGGSTPTTTAFPQQSAPNTATVFGQKTDSVDTTANLFGQLLSDGSSKPVFGGSPSTPTASNLFTKNIFETPSTTTASLFGSSFGSSVFGQPTTTSSVFGQPQTSTSTSFFGQSSFNAFGRGTPVTSNQTAFKSTGFSEPIFGSSVFGQSFKSTTNAPAFGTPSSSIFGGAPSSTTTNVFQTPTTSTTFGSASPPGPFSGGTSTFGESAFGSPPTFQKPLGGFGSPPVFGSTPGASTFGGSPTFGGSHSFGSPPTFGSVSQSTFGQTTGSTTFENLANQNIVGFGNLAQQSQSDCGGNFAKPAFGGNSFSSWRSK